MNSPATPRGPTRMTPVGHTPGPWRLEIGGDERMVISETARDPDGEFMLVCDLFRGGYVYDEAGAQYEANARLITTAPELLIAAMDAEWVLDSIVEDEELGDECPRFDGFDLCGARCCEQSGCIVERLARVRAALAKARGETS